MCFFLQRYVVGSIAWFVRIEALTQTDRRAGLKVVIRGKATSYKVKNGFLKMAFSDEPISNLV